MTCGPGGVGDPLGISLGAQIPALLLHISEHLLLATSRNSFLCQMDLWFALDRAVPS